MGKMAFNTPLSERRILQIQYMLRREDMTAQEVADGIFIDKRWAQEYLNHLHNLKQIHVSEYRKFIRSNGSPYHIPVYCWGHAADAKKPKPMTRAEVARRYRNNPMHRDERRMRDTMTKRAKRTKPHRDWTAAWIPTQGNR